LLTRIPAHRDVPAVSLGSAASNPKTQSAGSGSTLAVLLDRVAGNITQPDPATVQGFLFKTGPE